MSLNFLSLAIFESRKPCDCSILYTGNETATAECVYQPSLWTYLNLVQYKNKYLIFNSLKIPGIKDNQDNPRSWVHPLWNAVPFNVLKSSIVLIRNLLLLIPVGLRTHGNGKIMAIIGLWISCSWKEIIKLITFKFFEWK